MNNIIREKLDEIEKREDVKIIHAVESGSRAWGFASPDSDYDVRFIYVRKCDFYLKLEKTRDVIEWQLDDTLDINGWDIQKTLRLLYKSNPTLFEWNASPIIYKTTDAWKEVSSVVNEYFHAKSGLYHYVSTAKSNYREFLRGDMVKLKKYFYVLRPVLACKWILDKKTPPPMLFSELAEAELEAEIKPVVDELLNLKINTPEIGEGKRIDALNDYLDTSIEAITHIISEMDDGYHNNWERLNEIFLNILGE